MKREQEVHIPTTDLREAYGPQMTQPQTVHLGEFTYTRTPDERIIKKEQITLPKQIGQASLRHIEKGITTTRRRTSEIASTFSSPSVIFAASTTAVYGSIVGVDALCNQSGYLVGMWTLGTLINAATTGLYIKRELIKKNKRT